MPRVGIALGGWGVRGLAHIQVLELLDELDLRPCAMAGTSMGSLIGALYASGLSGRAIRELVESHLVSPREALRARVRKGAALLKWVRPHLSDLRHGGLISPDHFLLHLLGGIMKPGFEDLEIPLTIVATDFWTGEEVALRRGDLHAAIRASIAIPGVFPPLPQDGRILVDGGLSNAVPYSQLSGCDLVIAVDVGRAISPGPRDAPNPLEALLGAFDILQDDALERRLAAGRPDILVRARIADVRILDFAKAVDVLAQARPAVEDLRRELARRGFSDRAGSGAG